MLRINTQKLINSLWQIDDKGQYLNKPIHFYLHEIIVQSALNENPTAISVVDFNSFSIADLEEYYSIISPLIDDTLPQIQHITDDLSKINALQSSKISFF